jgi:5-methylcytosine-specific restriction endonuclease McrA
VSITMGKTGTIRLHGRHLEQLRLAVFTRDKSACVDCGTHVAWDGFFRGHMSHIKSRGAGGSDCLENCVVKCRFCHLGKDHAYGPSGVKPCPKKVMW